MFELFPLLLTIVAITLIGMGLMYGFDTSDIMTGSIVIMHIGPYVGSNNW
jgi:hypothetical protein